MKKSPGKSPMKFRNSILSHNIVDMFKKQWNVEVNCPACGINVIKSKLNFHLDNECSCSKSTSNGERKSENSEEVVIISEIKSRVKPVPKRSRCVSFADIESDDDFVVTKESKSKIEIRKKPKLIAESKSSNKQSTPLNPFSFKDVRNDNELSVSRKSGEKNKVNINSKSVDDIKTLSERVSASSDDSHVDTKIKNLSSAVQRARRFNKPIPSLSSFVNKTFVGKKTLNTTSTFEVALSSTSQSTKSNERIANKQLLEFNNNENFNSMIPSAFDNEESSLLAEAFEDAKNNADDNKKVTVMYPPYYITNFKYIIDKVLNDEYNKHLFDEMDLKYVQTFYLLSDCAQKLYVRLFQRKYKWQRPGNLNYSEIADDLVPVFEELAQSHFFDSKDDLIELETALNLLSLDEIKSLSKHFNCCPSGKNKAEIIQLLIKHGKQYKSQFFSGSNSVSSIIFKKVKQILGPCYRLSLEPKRLFTRILMLFSLPTISEDDEEEAAGGQQLQLFTLLQVNKGELVFPNYKVTRQFQIFENRDSLLRYESARQIENDILNAVESKKFELAKDFYLNAKDQYNKLLVSDVAKRDQSMPFHLRRYSACHVYTRCLYHGVEILQKLRQYEKAVEQLRELLNQKVFAQDRRGKWWERLVLNLKQHLKQREEATNCVKEALQDPYVRVGLRHSLLIQAERLKKNKTDDDELNECVLEMSDLIKAPTVTINGRVLPQPMPHHRNVFISSAPIEESSGQVTTVLGVEQLAIEHYQSEGYPEGIHGEGCTFISLYTLLFWDIIYNGEIPDAFISPHQYQPLDLNSDDFFVRRKSQIESHVDKIRSLTSEELCEIVRTTWLAHHGKASLVSWDMLTDVERAEGLVSCFGGEILASICERLAKDFRFTRSGVPDLVVWNPDAKLVKVVEVKGPGDRLSSKQILWLDYLIKAGVDAEVCLVTAVGSKMPRRQKSCNT